MGYKLDFERESALLVDLFNPLSSLVALGNVALCQELKAACVRLGAPRAGTPRRSWHGSAAFGEDFHRSLCQSARRWC